METKQTFVQMAQQAIENRQQWPSGHSEQIWETVDSSLVAWVKECKRNLRLILFKEGSDLNKNYYSQPFKVGEYVEGKGWEFTIDKADYYQWKKRTQKQLAIRSDNV